MTDNKDMSVETPKPAGVILDSGGRPVRSVVQPNELSRWQESVWEGLKNAAFPYSVTEYEKQQSEKRANGHIVSSSASQFENDAGRVLEEEAIKNLKDPISQAIVEPAGQTSTNVADFESTKT